MQPVTMYTGPSYPYCTMAEKLFVSSDVSEINEIRVDHNPEDLARMRRHAGQRSVPQTFIGDIHVGGFIDLYSLHQRGRLEALLNP